MPHITAIGAHPDDLEIFMYGMLAACQARGDTLSLIVATDGAAGGDHPGAELAARRAMETQTGLASLGQPIMLNLPDGRLATDDGAAMLIRDAVLDQNPDLVITHAPEDYHPDHRALSRLVADAAGFRCPLLYADTLMGTGFVPEYYVDITPYMAAKEAAIMAHESQEPHRFVAATRIHNRFRAAQMNAPDGHYMEAYRHDRRFPFADIRAILPPPPPIRPFYIRGSDALI